jgi:hypothetical protein
MNELPLYECHKEVRAAKIEAVQFFGPNGECAPEDSTSVLLHFRDTSIKSRQESTENRPKPQPGWYLIFYKDGYHSFSPAKLFEEGYTLKV